MHPYLLELEGTYDSVLGLPILLMTQLLAEVAKADP